MQVKSNDLGIFKRMELVSNTECDILWLWVLLPSVHILWSELLQRLYWHHANDSKAIENTHKRVNKYSFILNDDIR